MKTLRLSAIAAVAALSMTPGVGAAAVFGSLANFDVVNDTGFEAHGFEIDLAGIKQTDVVDVFGLNRNFGTSSPGTVERYGLPTIGDLTDGGGNVIGVKVTYQATFSGGTWSTGTASGIFNTPGESCWQFGNVNYPNVPCDHFGVSTYGNPTSTTYKWLVDPSNSGSLTAAAVGIPSVNFTPPPPPTPQVPAPPVVAVIKAVQVDPVAPQDNAYWVKIVQTSLPENVDMNDLMGGDNRFAVKAIADLNNKPETEIEWQVLQPGKVDEVSKALNLGAADKSVVVRYEFYKYLGQFDGEGLVDPLSNQFPVGDQLNQFVGDYIGEQVAGFNAVQAAVPESETWAMMLVGLGLVGLQLRKRRTRLHMIHT